MPWDLRAVRLCARTGTPARQVAQAIAASIVEAKMAVGID